MFEIFFQNYVKKLCWIVYKYLRTICQKTISKPFLNNSWAIFTFVWTIVPKNYYKTMLKYINIYIYIYIYIYIHIYFELFVWKLFWVHFLTSYNNIIHSKIGLFEIFSELFQKYVEICLFLGGTICLKTILNHNCLNYFYWTILKLCWNDNLWNICQKKYFESILKQLFTIVWTVIPKL